MTNKCSICGKTRKAHYDNIYCYAASKTIKDVAYIFPIKEYVYTPIIQEENQTNA